MLTRLPAPRRTLLLTAWLTLCACPGPPPVADAGQGDAGPVDAGDWLDPASYCEQAVEVFCPFYLRCGRIAEADLASCRRTFLESCNAIYEPRYRGLAEAGLLELSARGLSACASHLATVPCEHQLLDLDGPCAAIWRGQAGAGAACGVGIDSFVCDGDTTCVVGLDLCGVCETAAPTNGVCGDGIRCRYPDLCVEGHCVGPALPGAPCSATRRCISGAACTNSVCVARQFVGVGEACDAERRCRYRSTCLGGRCVLDALLGESCSTSVHCASGSCDTGQGVCVPLGEPGAGCSEGSQCQAGRCISGSCDALLSACFD